LENFISKDITLEGTLDPVMQGIASKVLEGHQITTAECLTLFEKAGLGFLGMLADVVRMRYNGDKAWFIRNFHIEPTNICVNRCSFCSFSHHFSESKWELSVDEILEKVSEQDETVREIHITGAVHPKRDLKYYGDLIRRIRERRPSLHIKAYSAVELDYMIKKAGMTFREGIQFLKDCGLDSVPGGGAEIFDEGIRSGICGMKTGSADWLEIHRTAHLLGLPSNATMLYGHVENYSQRVDHLDRLRVLQGETGGFNAFIPLKFHSSNNEMKGIPEVSVTEDMKMYAVSRIFLDNFPHIKAYWPALGRKMAQVSLAFGVDDMDGTINDSTKIYSLAGAEEQSPVMTVSGMTELIRTAGRVPAERDSLYRPV
jgi:aminodeoxyfutalosine synthase